MPYNPLQIHYNPLQIHYNPLLIHHNPLKMPYNPLKLPSHPLPIHVLIPPLLIPSTTAYWPGFMNLQKAQGEQPVGWRREPSERSRGSSASPRSVWSTSPTCPCSSASTVGKGGWKRCI